MYKTTAPLTPRLDEKGRTTEPARPNRRTVLTVAAWSTPVIVASMTTPATAASTTAFQLAFSGLPASVSARSAIPQFTVSVLQDSALATAPQRVVVTLGNGLVWGQDGVGAAGSQTVTSAGGIVVLGGAALPISAPATGNFAITVSLEADPSVTASTTVKVGAASYTLAWTPSAVQSAIADEPFTIATALVGTVNGARKPNIVTTVTPSADMAWTTGNQGGRSLSTGADGSLAFAAGTFTPTTYAMHSISAQVAGDPSVKATLKVFAIPREALDWVKDFYVYQGKVNLVVPTTVQKDANRLVLKCNGNYLGESYASTVYYTTVARSDNGSATLTQNLGYSAPVNGSDAVSVTLAPGKPGDAMAGEYPLRKATVPVVPDAASTWVTGITTSAEAVRIEIDKEAVDTSANRIIYYVDGEYMGEDDGGVLHHGSRSDGSSSVTRTFAVAAGSHTVDVRFTNASPKDATQIPVQIRAAEKVSVPAK